MTEDIEKYRRWIQGDNREYANGIYFLGKGIIQELGKEKGAALIIRQIEEMSINSGMQFRKALEGQGLNNSLKNFFRAFGTGDSVVNFAWVYDVKKFVDHEIVVEYSYCPIAEGFKRLGQEAVEIGELHCSHADNSIMQGYNPDYECKRESSLNLDGLCRLHWKKKQKRFVARY